MIWQARLDKERDEKMDKQTTIEMEYRSKRKSYEEQEEELRRQKNKGIAILEEVQDRSNYYLRDYVPDQDILTQGLRKLDYMKEKVLENGKLEQKKLAIKMDELDRDYRIQLRTIKSERKGKSIE